MSRTLPSDSIYAIMLLDITGAKQSDTHKDDNLLELVGDLCSFILDQIIHVRGTYHDRKSELGRHSQYQHLRETKRLALGR